jgi:hypothetical protein
MKENEIDYKKKAEAVLDTLNELVRSVNYFSRTYFNNDIIAQKTYMEAIRFGVKQAKIDIPKAETPMDACQIYIDILEAVGLMASKQFDITQTDGDIFCKVYPPCMYAEACKNTQKEGITPTCLRGLVFHVFIKDSTGESYRIKVVEFNPDQGCLIQIHPLIGND